MSHEEPPDTGSQTEATDPDSPTTVSGCVVAALVLAALLTIIGLVLGYVAALVVVKLGLPAPKLIVGLPLIAVLSLAWALSLSKRPRDILLTVGTAALLASALLTLANPPHPSTLFETRSELVDVDVDLENDSADLTIRSEKSLAEIPDFSTMLILASLLACLAMCLCGTIKPLYEGHQARKQAKFF